MGINIELDNPHKSYFAGQTVEGRVVIHNSEPIQLQEVSILLDGKGRVKWNEQLLEEPTVLHYSAEEIYLNQKKVLEGDGEHFFTSPQGTQSYPFSFKLPKNLPSSFITKSCHLSYALKAEMKRPIPNPKDKSQLHFTVNGIFDLNKEGGEKLPQECRKRKGSNLNPFNMGELSFHLSLPKRSGFVPGEVLGFKVLITNGNKQKVHGVTASIEQVIKVNAKETYKTMKNIICQVQGPEIGKGDHEPWRASLMIPAVPPTKLGGECRIIDLQYFFHFEMRMTGLNMPLGGSVPLLIGTVPLRATFGDLQRQSGGEVNAWSPPFPTLFPEHPDLPTPSYTKAIAEEGLNWNRRRSVQHHGSVEEQVVGARRDPDQDTSHQSSQQSQSATHHHHQHTKHYVPRYITYSMKA